MNEKLRPSNDSKTRAYSSQMNTFGLLPGPEGTCPDATFGPGGCMEIKPGRKCPTCYVHKIANFRKNIMANLQHNTDLLKQANKDEMSLILANEFNRFELNEIKKERTDRNYRLHWSGDIFSSDYADALIDAMSQFPGIQFWGYTRSISLYPKFANLPNCILYLSVDDVNFEQAYPIYRQHCHHQNLSIAYLRATQPDYINLAVCPADAGIIGHEGACHHCRQCLRGVPIWLKTR